jgi:hypothetical protein
MLFHSFPRPRGNEPVDEAKGLKILENIFKSGLLLVPEVIQYPPEYPGGDEYRLVQSRFCLTQLDDLESLERHAVHFGTFHLEFDDKTIYSLGVIPVMYLPKRSSRPSADGSAPLADLGGFFIHRLLELQNLCTKMKQLDDLLLKNRFRGTITVGDKTDKTAETFTVNVKQAKTVLKMLCRDIESFDRIQGAIQGFASLFYPIDGDRKDYEPLYYFRQREWRIVRGIVLGKQTTDKAIDEQLDPAEKKALLEIDPVFYGKGEKELEFIDGKRPKVCECTAIRKIGKKTVWEMMDYIIVPAAKLEAARELAKRYNIDRGKIVDMETRKAIKAKAGAAKQSADKRVLP